MKNLLAVVGATATGKTGLAVALAAKLNGEIVSADSRQLFRGMDLGTGKDLQEYGDIPYHLIDIAEPGEEFNIFAYQRLAYKAIEEIRQRKALPLLVGGSGMYLEAILNGYRLIAVPENPALRAALHNLTTPQLTARLQAARPKQHNTTDLKDRERIIRAIEIAEGEKPLLAKLPPPPPINPLILGIRWPRPILRQRITTRLEQRLAEGMIAEVENLLTQGVSHQRLAFYGLEYRFISQMLQGELNQETMFQKLNQAIHKFAKRQETWFRRMEKKGLLIEWLDGGDEVIDAAFAAVDGVIFG